MLSRFSFVRLDQFQVGLDVIPVPVLKETILTIDFQVSENREDTASFRSPGYRNLDT